MYVWILLEYSKGAEWGFIILWQARAIVILKCNSVNAGLLGAAVLMQVDSSLRKWLNLVVTLNY